MGKRIQPFWQQIWPRSLQLDSPQIAESLAELSIAAGDKFPVALDAVEDWLLPLEHPHHVVHLLHESGLCCRCPTDALRLLNAVIDDQQLAPLELGNCLDEIGAASPQLLRDTRYIRLRDYLRKRGM